MKKERKKKGREYSVGVKSYMSANCLHGSRNGFTVAQDLVQVLGAQNVAQRRLGQEASRVMGVLHVGHRHGRVRHAKVNDGVHRHRHAVLGQHLNTGRQLGQCVSSLVWFFWGGTIVILGSNLLGRNVEDSRTQIHFGVSLDARQDEENS